MPIVSSDISYKKSSQTDSDGGTISVTSITDNVLNNLWDDVSTEESVAGDTEYRKMFVKNGHASLTWGNVKVYRSQNSDSPDDEVSVGIGSANDTDGSSELSALSGNSVIAVISNGADTRQVTIVGEDAATGLRATETLTLNNAVEVLGVQSFSKIYLVYVSSSDSNRTITIKQGSGGTTRGTIGQSKYSAIYYQNPTSVSGAFLCGNISAGNAQAIWLKRVVQAGADGYTSNSVAFTATGETS